MTKKISLVTKADPIYGSAPGAQSLRPRPLPHPSCSANYSLVATGEGRRTPCRFYRAERQGAGLRFSRTKRKEEKTNQPLKRRDAAPLQNRPGPHGSKQTRGSTTGIARGLRRKKSRPRTESCDRTFHRRLEVWNRNSFCKRSASFSAPLPKLCRDLFSAAKKSTLKTHR